MQVETLRTNAERERQQIEMQRSVSHRALGRSQLWCDWPSCHAFHAAGAAPTSSPDPSCRPPRSTPQADLGDAPDALTDEDLQLSLAVCYELHYRGFDEVADGWEWDPALLAAARRPGAAAPWPRCASLVGASR